MMGLCSPSDSSPVARSWMSQPPRNGQAGDDEAGDPDAEGFVPDGDVPAPEERVVEPDGGPDGRHLREEPGVLTAGEAGEVYLKRSVGTRDSADMAEEPIESNTWGKTRAMWDGTKSNCGSKRRRTSARSASTCGGVSAMTARCAGMPQPHPHTVTAASRRSPIRARERVDHGSQARPRAAGLARSARSSVAWGDGTPP
jgi:hypothetical protein